MEANHINTEETGSPSMSETLNSPQREDSPLIFQSNRLHLMLWVCSFFHTRCPLSRSLSPYPPSLSLFRRSLLSAAAFFLCYGNLSWQFATKCGIFINETVGNIKSQLNEAIKSGILIGLLPPPGRFPSSLPPPPLLCVLSVYLSRVIELEKKVLNNCVKYVFLYSFFIIYFFIGLFLRPRKLSLCSERRNFAWKSSLA